MKVGKILALSLAAALALTGCAAKSAPEEPENTAAQTVQQSMESVEQNAAERPELWKVLDRITEKFGVNEETARRYDEKFDAGEDAIVLLCRSESGKFTAYGFISPEYGKQGILIDNIINGESNWNTFEEYGWSYGDVQPTLEEQNEYDVIFTFLDGDGAQQSVAFESFDTGTVSVREN